MNTGETIKLRRSLDLEGTGGEENMTKTYILCKILIIIDQILFVGTHTLKLLCMAWLPAAA